MHLLSISMPVCRPLPLSRGFNRSGGPRPPLPLLPCRKRHPRQPFCAGQVHARSTETTTTPAVPWPVRGDSPCLFQPPAASSAATSPAAVPARSRPRGRPPRRPLRGLVRGDGSRYLPPPHSLSRGLVRIDVPRGRPTAPKSVLRGRACGGGDRRGSRAGASAAEDPAPPRPPRPFPRRRRPRQSARARPRRRRPPRPSRGLVRGRGLARPRPRPRRSIPQ